MYSHPIKFSVTGTYGNSPDGEDDVYTISEFRSFVEPGLFVDYDGFGHPVKDGLADEDIFIKPSNLGRIPNDATHIVWYNR